MTLRHKSVHCQLETNTVTGTEEFFLCTCPTTAAQMMSTPFKGGRHIVLLRLASALASGLTLRHPCSIFFGVHQNMIPAIQRSFSTGQGQACRGHHTKNHLN